MEEKNKLTNDLKLIETEIYEKRQDLKRLIRLIENQNQYEDDLIQRLEGARQKQKQLRIDFFNKTNELTEKYNETKKIVEIFTGNFYSTYNL